MIHPVVTIIIPVYNVEKFIDRCTRSLFSQELNNIEFIFIDDCSSDQSMNVLQCVIKEFHLRILEKNWLIKIEKMPRNSGQAVVRKYGISMATGDYIIHCDSDDWIEHNMISEMWNLAHKNDLDVVVCDYDHYKKQGIKRYKCLSSCEAKVFFDEVVSIFASWSLCNKLFKRTLYTNNSILFPCEGMNVGEDMAVVIQLLFYCTKVGYIEKAFYHYIENEGSITNKKNVHGIINNYIQWVGNICLLQSFFKDKDIYEKVEKKLSYGVVFATDDVLVRLCNVGQNRCFLITKLCLCVWKSKNISQYGKKRVWRYMRRMFCSSMKQKLYKFCKIR